MASTDPKEKWYYDACLLDDRLSIYKELINEQHRSCTSHLAIGEACGNFIEKATDGNYQNLNTFIDLLKKLKNAGRLEIVGNDGIEPIVEKIKSEVSRISETDAMHAATAIREKCCILRTLDSDFDGFTRDVCKKLANDNGMEKFAVTRMSDKDKSLLFKVSKMFSKKK